MHEITPEAIAALATRILNETRGGAVGPANPSAVAEPMQLATSARPTSGMPSTASPDLRLPRQVMPPSMMASNIQTPPSVPQALNAHPVVSSEISPGAEDGLRTFIQQVREGHWAVNEVPPTTLRDSDRSASPNVEFARFGTKPGSTAADSVPHGSIQDVRHDVSKATGPRIRFARSTGPLQGSPVKPTSSILDVVAIRKDFPVLNQSVNGRPLVWFDNAATTQKPLAVIDAISEYYKHDNSNIHRAAHTLAARSTDAYEGARTKIQKFLGASDAKEIVLVRGTTEAINLVSNTFGRKLLREGDEIILTEFEHHANIVPWQMLAREKGLTIRVVPFNDRGEILLSEYERLLGPRTKFVGMTHASNSLGTILPVQEMTSMAKRYGAKVLIDGAQTVAHLAVDVQELGCDFYVFSGHKIFGPTGIGAVYIHESLHDLLPPWQGGGNMIRTVSFEETRYAEAPAKFEAGTPNIADAVGLGAALDYVSHLGLHRIAQYEHELLAYATLAMQRIPGLRLIGTATEKVGVLSFVLPPYKPEAVGKALDQQGIAVRSGHHCAQPSLRHYGLEATVRPSLAFYNTYEEVDRMVEVLTKLAAVS